MSDQWEAGLSHFVRGNYYAARDLWTALVADTEDVQTLAATYNSLGAVAGQLRGPNEALRYFQLAEATSRRTDPADPMRIKYLNNLAFALSQLDRLDEALSASQEALNLVSHDTPRTSVNALNIWAFLLWKRDLQTEILQHAVRFRDFLTELDESLVPKQDLAMSYHRLGYAYRMSGRMDDALEYFVKATQRCELPETIGELASLHLFRGEVDQSLAYAERLYASLMGSPMTPGKVDLAECLELIAVYAYYCGQTTLYERCLEKAELYYGQLLRWASWIAIRNLPTTLAGRNIRLPAAALDWDRWTSFLDDLSLTDGIEAMFPQLFRASLHATNLAIRVAAMVVPAIEQHRADLRMAGRMAYLGMTALATSEQEAARLLRQGDIQPEVSDLGGRLLQAYPHTSQLRDIVSYARRPAGEGVSTEKRLMSQCLGIALDLIEALEFYDCSHVEGVTLVLKQRKPWYDDRVVEAFRNETLMVRVGG